jgi:hypothetical protein
VLDCPPDEYDGEASRIESGISKPATLLRKRSAKRTWRR